MDTSLILISLLNLPILLFFIGGAAVFLKPGLEISQPIPKVLDLYLLFTLVFKDGHKFNAGGFAPGIVVTLVLTVMLAAIVPIYYCFISRWKLAPYAGEISPAYGAISAVDSVMKIPFLQRINIEFYRHVIVD